MGPRGQYSVSVSLRCPVSVAHVSSTSVSMHVSSCAVFRVCGTCVLLRQCSQFYVAPLFASFRPAGVRRSLVILAHKLWSSRRSGEGSSRRSGEGRSRRLSDGSSRRTRTILHSNNYYWETSLIKRQNFKHDILYFLVKIYDCLFQLITYRFIQCVEFLFMSL